MNRKPFPAFILIIAAILAYTLVTITGAKASVSHVYASATEGLEEDILYPMCLNEDGSGQALCYWDATKQGNGKGTSTMSGDCIDALGTSYLNDCLILHPMSAYTKVYSDGSEATWPSGSDLVMECVDINRNTTIQDRIESGFDLGQCFKAQMPTENGIIK